MKIFHRKSIVENGKPSLSSTRQDDPLRTLCQGDETMYQALSLFVLLNPEGQAQLGGSPSELAERARKFLSQGNKLGARINFEVAARLGIYLQDRQGAQMMLEQAASVTDDSERLRIHKYLLSNLDTAMRIALEFYRSIHHEPKSPKVALPKIESSTK
ncbi:MAG TPA: hypothetical protein VJN71_11315 [Nitrososphaerales archaeon]|nr:hypothetical protein [Nitrososphaerales archaeon]